MQTEAKTRGKAPPSVVGRGRTGPSAMAAPTLLFYLLFFCIASNRSPASAVDFLFNSFKPGDLTLVGDARVDASTVRLTDSNQFSLGRAFYPARLTMLRRNATVAGVQVSSFSTSFVFSVLPEIPSSPGFGLAFVLSASTSPPGAIAGQYFGLFSNATRRRSAPLLAVEFDTGQNPEFADPDGNHVGIDLNYIESSATAAAGYNRTGSSGGGEEFVAIDMRSGRNVRAWVDFDGPRQRIEVTLAPAEVTQKPPRPLLSYTDPEIPSYLSEEMFVGFSASKTRWVEAQRVLAWSLSDGGSPAREINTTGLPDFSAPPPSSSSPSAGLIAGVTSAAVALALGLAGLCYYFCCRRGRGGHEEEDVEEWEVKYWPHRFSYAELRAATKGFSAERLLGYGGFGKVYRGVLPKNKVDASDGGAEDGKEVAVKCVSHDSKQGLREFMAEISSIGRLRHKNLVHMRGWCRRGTELMLVYDYMPNGSLDRWVFPRRGGGDREALGWEGRRRVLGDVAEGLQYLHYGWDQVVLHRDVKCSNILLDSGMRGRLGDFGLARLYQHGEAPSSTRVVGTLGYLAPELARVPAPTAASDVYSFGVVVLEVASGRRAIEPGERMDDDDVLLVEWVRDLYEERRVLEAADRRVEGEFRPEEMELVLKLGLACCHPDPTQRPSMKEVVAMLLGDDGQHQQQHQEANTGRGGSGLGGQQDSGLMGGTG